jgi:hypothetical protein
MAPEVIKCDPDSKTASSANYTDKSDIWSLGITAIEITEKNPPLSDIHPMQALTMIAKSDMGFAKPKNFSKPLVEFVNSMIIKNPDKRPTATVCLNHPFMVAAEKLNRDGILTELVRKTALIKEKKKKGLDITEEDELGVPAKNTSVAASDVSTNVPADTLNLKAKQMFGNIIQKTPFSTTSSHAASLDGSTLPTIDDFPTVANNVQEGITCIFEPIILTTLSEVLTADFLDGQYILIGTEKGLFYLDIQKPSLKVPIPIISDIRFRQIQVLSEYNVLIALSGKHDHIRQYNLASIRKLILFIEGNAAALIDKTNTNVPMLMVQLGQTDKTEYDYLNANQNIDQDTLLNQWANDFIKIVNTRDTREFSIEQTETTAYLCILGQGITLFRWAVDPYKKFMKIKSFWVPETPKFVTLTNDGIQATELFVGYSSELNRVSIQDSKVTELKVHKEMKAKASGKQRWQSFLQIPYSDTKLESILRDNARGTINRKLAAVTGPTLARPLQASDKYFLGTYDRLTKVVDKNSYPMVGAGVGGWKDGVMWSEVPITQILRPLQHVITVGMNTIEIVEWKSAGLRQRMTVDSSSSFRVLTSTHGETLIAVDKKKIGSMLYWMRESTPPPRPVGDILENILKEQAPVNLLDQKDLEILGEMNLNPSEDGSLAEYDDDKGEAGNAQDGYSSSNGHDVGYSSSIAQDVGNSSSIGQDVGYSASNAHAFANGQDPRHSPGHQDATYSPQLVYSPGPIQPVPRYPPGQMANVPQGQRFSPNQDARYSPQPVYSPGPIQPDPRYPPGQMANVPQGQRFSPTVQSPTTDPSRYNFVNDGSSRSSIDSGDGGYDPRMQMQPRIMRPQGRPYARPYLEPQFRNPHPQFAPRFQRPPQQYQRAQSPQPQDPRFYQPRPDQRFRPDPRMRPAGPDPRLQQPMGPDARLQQPLGPDPRLQQPLGPDPRLQPGYDPRMQRPRPMNTDPRFDPRMRPVYQGQGTLEYRPRPGYRPRPAPGYQQGTLEYRPRPGPPPSGEYRRDLPPSDQ